VLCLQFSVDRRHHRQQPDDSLTQQGTLPLQMGSGIERTVVDQYR
jgi:hypothetical protein